MTRALLEQALEALECAYSENYDGAKIHGAKVAIRAHLAQPQGEPGVSCGDCPTRDYKAPATAPAQPERKPTTDAQCIELFHKVQRGMGFKDHDVIPFISGVAAGEHFHGIKETP